MRTILKEKIGNPDLFAGRKKELAYLLNWMDSSKKELSKSTAILSRRKTGKTALLQRLFNLAFERCNGVVPFYFEVRETDQWLGDFAERFFLAFVLQYLGYKTRRPEYIERYELYGLEEAEEAVREERFPYLEVMIRRIRTLIQQGKTDILWDTVRDAPRMVAAQSHESVVQMIDEFQFLNRFIFWDKEKTRRADNLAGSYLHTAEYKNAPLLISGSWVGWLMDDVNRLLPGRFVYAPLEPMPDDEALEMVVRYALIQEQPVTEETAYLMVRVSEGNPFYISALFQSRFSGKDLTTPEGVQRTLEYETLHLDGSINATWMEYIDAAFPRINEIYAKDMVLYLSKHRHETVSRKKLKEILRLDMSDAELEKKFKALFRSDIIEEHHGRYRGVQDNIFDKVFRRSYAEDIDTFVTEEATNENRALFEHFLAQHRALQGEHNRYKGAFAELAIAQQLRNRCIEKPDLFMSMLSNLPEDFAFAEYSSVGPFHSPPLFVPEFQIDIFARAGADQYSLIFEVKNRKEKFSLREAETFMENVRALAGLESLEHVVPIVFSASGFYRNALTYFDEHGIAFSRDERWLDYYSANR